jgi:hypothetical protein
MVIKLRMMDNQKHNCRGNKCKMKIMDTDWIRIINIPWPQMDTELKTKYILGVMGIQCKVQSYVGRSIFNR